MPKKIKLIALLSISLFIDLAAHGLTTDEITSSTASVNGQRIINADREPENWLSHGRNYQEQRFSPLKQIDDENVNKLGLAWSFDTDSNRGLEATPIVVDGVMYTTGVWSVVYANNAKTGELLWKYNPQVPREWGANACCDAVNRGAALWEGKVFVGTLDGRLIALDAATGKLIWETLTIDRSFSYTITGAPRVIEGKVIIGNGGAEFGVRGYVTAYDANTGNQLWRFYTVPGNPADGFEHKDLETAAKTWNGEWWKKANGSGGGTVWDSMAYDPELNLLYIGVGNGSVWNTEIRSPGGGDNLYLSSIVALNPDNGTYVWHYQTTPGDKWDYTATQHIILADIKWQGEPRKVLLQAPKNGFFFVIDRITGELLSAEPYVDVNWASHYDMKTGRPVMTDTANYLKDGPKFIKPGAIGAHNWHPMSYSPQTGLVYIPVIDSGLNYKALEAKDFLFQPQGNFNLGVDISESPPGELLLGKSFVRNMMSGYLEAWDPIQQKIVWKVEHPLTWNGGVLSTAGNLVFQGTADGRFVAYAADSGKKLWQFKTQTGVIASPISYAVDGEQYVSVMASWGGAIAIGSGEEPKSIPAQGRILTFKLHADKKLPPIAKRIKFDPPPRLNVSDETLEQGKMLFHNYCSRCHGLMATSNGAIPDLRYMHTSKHELFNQIVFDGILAKAGMIGFGNVLSKDEVDAIHAYVIEQGNQAKELRAMPKWLRKSKEWLYKIFTQSLAQIL